MSCVENERRTTDSPCYIAALRILAHRFNSEVELRRKLKAKRKFEPEEIDAAIARLHEERWLDDARYAGAFVRTRVNKRIGSERIVRELQSAGIPEGDATLAVRSNVDVERESENLLALCRKRMDALARRHGNDFVATREGCSKVAAWLVSKGYPADDAWRVTKELLGSSGYSSYSGYS